MSEGGKLIVLNKNNSEYVEFDSDIFYQLNGFFIRNGDIDDNIYKFEIVENNNGYKIRIYQRIYLNFYSETIGYITTDISYDKNGK